ncbi:MAG: hypothetical protein KIT44_02980 [Opitutaceae bacterium]|nr:hypothetical protein [Opitutaceae bacterium]
MNGYLAPELSGVSRFSSRNALVDSYGIGMTLFFIVSGRAPLFTESQHADWVEKLQKEIGREPSKEWHSLNQRWARLIYWTTKPNQSERWDIVRILGELEQLHRALKNPTKNASAELAAEEILARTKEGGRTYHWNVDTLCGYFELRTGFKIEIKGDESSKEVKFECDWMNTGDRKFENVKKYLGPATERLDGIMRTGGWNFTGKRSQADSVHFTATIPIEKLQFAGAIAKAVESVDAAVENLKLGNA